MSGEQGPKNGSPLSSLLELAKGGDKYIQLGTILVVILAGAGNFITTWQDGHETRKMTQEDRRDLSKAIQEVHEMHRSLDSTIDRQKDIEKHVSQILDKVTQQK